MSELPAETTEKLKRTSGACYLFNNQNRRARGGGLPSSYKLPELSESRRELNSRYKSADPACARPISRNLADVPRILESRYSSTAESRRGSATLCTHYELSLYSELQSTWRRISRRLISLYHFVSMRNVSRFERIFFHLNVRCLNRWS